MYLHLCVCSGGRKIEVVGSGFDLIQRATMKVLPSTDEFSQNTRPVEVSTSRTTVNFSKPGHPQIMS